MAISPSQLGQGLLSQGFEVWCRFMFAQIEGRIFTREPLHDKIFSTFKSIYELDPDFQYINKNLPPRSGKTITTCYFIAYVIAHKKQCEFIYTSQSAKLLRDVADNISKILNSNIYKSMYNLEAHTETKLTSFVSEYFKDYFYDVQKEEKTSFSTTLIRVPNGKIHLSPLGGQIVGLGFGVRDAEYYSGGLFLDDIDKPSDVKSSMILRERTHEFFSSTLITRANNPHANITNIQQRICIGDMSDFLSENYYFESVKAPLFVDNVCQLPKQYDDKRIEMIKVNKTDFLAQYQQEPISVEGNLFKINWFSEVEAIPNDYDFTFITADTAYKEKQQSDYTVFTLWGKRDNNLYRMDSRRKKISAVDIEDWIEPWIRSKMGANFRYVWIEPQGHGIYLNQAFRKKGIPIPYEDDLNEYMSRSGKQSKKRKGAGDKVTRANNIIPSVDRINKNVIFYKGCPDHEDFMSELVSFPNGKHDDSVDTFIDGMNIAFNNTLRDWSKVADL